MNPLRVCFRGKCYKFNSFTGWLTSRHTDDVLDTVSAIRCQSKKGNDILRYVINPYLTRNTTKFYGVNHIPFRVRFYALTLIWLHRHFFPGIYLFSKCRFAIFDNAAIATDAFCKIHPENQRVLCLPRSVFAATTSKRFPENGALFIGAFLPSHHMHAWIIEDGTNAYRYDTIWTNYTPVSIMV